MLELGNIERDSEVNPVLKNASHINIELMIIENSGFESGLAHWEVFNGIANLTSDAFAGDNAISLASNRAGIDQGFSVLPGETYTLSGYAKTTESIWNGFGVTFYDDSWTVLDKISTRITGDTWSEYSFDALAPAGSSRGVLWAWKGGDTGTTELDELTVSGSTPTPPSPSPTDGELLSNPDFENNLADWNTFRGSETVTADAFEGNSAIQLSENGSGISQSVGIVGGETYQLSGYGKYDGTFRSGLGIDFWDSSWTKIDGYSTSINSADWQLYEITQEAPANAAHATIWSWKGGNSGSTVLDALSLQSIAEPSVNQLPSITSNGGAASATLNIAENRTSIINLDASDPDGETEGSGLTYSLEGPDISQISIDPNTGELSFNAAPDFESPSDADGDNQYDVDVVVSDSQGGQDTQALAINITDVNEGAFSLEVSTVTVDEGVPAIDLIVNRLGSTSGTASVDYATEGQTAIALQDFIPVEGTLTFGDGQDSMTIRIPIIDDAAVEEDETFAVQLSSPTNGTTLGTQRSVVVINDTDQALNAGTLTFTGPMFMTNEGAGTAQVRVARVGGTDGTVTVNYTTSDDYATAGADYTATSGTLIFGNGVTEQFITVPILDDTDVEGPETFFLTLTDPVGGAVIGTESIMVAIADNDLAPPPPTQPEYRYIRFVANSEVNGNPWTSLAELNLLDGDGTLISQADWTLESVNSEELVVSNRPATQAFDSNPATFWHTEWAPAGTANDPSHPHEIVIDLGADYDISGFTYLPRQDVSQNGQVADYAFYVSANGTDWGSPVAAGELQNIKSEQTIRFDDFDPGDLIPGLVGHWKLNERLATAPVLDASGISSNGTAQNITGINGPFNAAPIFDTDNPRSWDFDGVDDYISIANDDDLDLSGGAFTQSVWINSDITDNAFHGILGNHNSGGVANRYPGIWVYQQNKIHAGFGDGTNWNNFITDAVLEPDAWNHVVVSFDGTTYNAFVNGDEVFATDEFAGRAPVSLGSFDIGRVDNYFDGQIDDVRIYNRGLTDTEIQSLYQEQPGAAQIGAWSEVIEFPNIPVSAASLPNGDIVTWSSWDRFQFSGNRFDRTYTSLFDTNTREVGEFLVTNTNHDMFCPGTVMLPDGRVLVNGGGGDTQFTSVYDFTTNTWSYVDSMEYGRWYNVSVTLGDGSVFTLGGNRSNGRRGPGELWTEDEGWRTLAGLPIDPISTSGNRGDEHPQLFAAPNGKVFIAGPSATMYWYDTSGNGSYTEAGLRGDDTYSQNGLTVMYDEGKLLRAGGQSVYSGGIVTDVAYDIDINNENNVTVDQQDPMNYKRSYATGVVMADGQVFVVGGTEKGVAFSDAEAVYRPEIWNPETGEWTLVDQQAVARTYHSVALLQPDGRVFVGGGGLCGNCSTNHSDAEIYTPAYLYNDDGTLADRPEISGGPDSAGYGQTIDITIGAKNVSKCTSIKALFARLNASKECITPPSSLGLKPSVKTYQMPTIPMKSLMWVNSMNWKPLSAQKKTKSGYGQR